MISCNGWDKQDGPLVVMECAILYESGFDRLVDEVLLVRAPERVCLERVMKRDGASEAQVKARMAASDVGRRALQTGALYYK